MSEAVIFYVTYALIGVAVVAWLVIRSGILYYFERKQRFTKNLIDSVKPYEDKDGQENV